MMVSFDSIPKTKNVAVLAAGPSIKENLPRIEKYIKEHSALVIASNYHYGIKSDYTCIGGFDKVEDLLKTPDTGTFVFLPQVKGTVERKTMRFKCLSKPMTKTNRILISDKGVINHEPYSAGFSAILLATFARPVEILISGFDGPKKNGKLIEYEHFNKEKIIDKKNSAAHRRQKKFVRYFVRMLLPFVKSRGIRMLAFDNDPLRGASKRRMRIKEP